MSYLRETIGQWLRPVPLSSLQRLAGTRLVIPLYHAVSNLPLPHIQPLNPVRSVERFKADIQWLQKRYRPIGLSDLEAASKAGNVFREPSFHLTFDDGLSQVLPLAGWLRDRGISATLFVNPPFVGNAGLMHRYKAALIVSRLKQEQSIPMRKQLAERLGVEPSKVQNHLMGLGIDELSVITDCLAIAKVDVRKFLETDKPYLTWDQLKSWIAAGHSLGAHSMYHPEFVKLDVASQLNEAFDSMSRLQKQLGVNNPAFAFPFTDWRVKPEFYAAFQERYPDSLIFGTRGVQKGFVPQHYQRLPVERTRLPLSVSLRGALFAAAFHSSR